MTLTSEQARQLGKRSGEARRKVKLTLSRVEGELGQLETDQDALRHLHQMKLWGLAGLVSGTVLNGCVRSVEVWLKHRHDERGTEIVRLMDRIDELEAELKEARRGKASLYG